MNRREMLARITGLTAALGIVADVEVAPAEPKPLFFVLKPARVLTTQERLALRQGWEALWKGPGETQQKLVIINPGDTLEVQTKESVG